MLVAQALRRYLNGSQQASLLTRTALLDPAIARATELMHSQPARLAGYDNEASLSKAFKREFGIPPGGYRARTLTTTAVQEPAC